MKGHKPQPESEAGLFIKTFPGILIHLYFVHNFVSLPNLNLKEGPQIIPVLVNASYGRFLVAVSVLSRQSPPPSLLRA